MDVYAVCKEQQEKPDFNTFFRGTGVFHDHHTGQALNKEKVVEAVRNDLDEMYSFSVLQWRRRSEKPASEKVISTTLFHKLKDEGTVRSRIVLRQFADVPLHEPSTNLVAETVSVIASKGNGRQMTSPFRSSTLG